MSCCPGFSLGDCACSRATSRSLLRNSDCLISPEPQVEFVYRYSIPSSQARAALVFHARLWVLDQRNDEDRARAASIVVRYIGLPITTQATRPELLGFATTEDISPTWIIRLELTGFSRCGHSLPHRHQTGVWRSPGRLGQGLAPYLLLEVNVMLRGFLIVMFGRRRTADRSLQSRPGLADT